MQKNNFTNEITKLATVSQAQERYKISRYSLMKFAEDHGAVVRFGKSVRIDIEKMDASLSNESEKR